MAQNDPGDDPKLATMRLRALAHPLRWKLLDVVTRDGSVTATRCAEILDESVASCWYHLGILRKYGYVEPIPGTSGREKPWRATAALQGDLSGPTGDADTEAAGFAAADAFLDHEVGRAKERIRRLGAEPPEWQATNMVAAASVYVTAEELAEIKAELVAILERYAERASDAERRPASSRAARIFVSTGIEPSA
ncbi:winged helix-turn-helix domain-containing protein [Hamadaea tsunoensis]|uniref:winged helix-turn-helix domain-containing protein n=1 Tax=Hamadaea tsunoensis TaxID=53368 RepID=UPI0004146375|nr:helix-turn-helix domain-containing protein [Hamadaea tsunoensis]